MLNSYMTSAGLVELTYGLRIWLVGLVLLLPVAVLGLAWAKSSRFFSTHTTARRQRILYLVALVSASVSALAYLCYWGWRVCRLYGVVLPLSPLIVLDRFLLLSRLLSIVAIVCFVIGKGPYRVLVILATLWIAVQIWVHDGVIHWA
jgi:hypothetical protein